MLTSAPFDHACLRLTLKGGKKKPPQEEKEKKGERKEKEKKRGQKEKKGGKRLIFKETEKEEDRIRPR